MKIIALILGVILIIFGVVYVTQFGADEAPVAEDGGTVVDEDISVDVDDEDSDVEDTPTMGMPVEGNDVMEMIVEENAISFDVAGYSFGYTMEEIRVKEGDTVTINFTSDSGYHDWVVDEFDAATEKVMPGTPTSVTFVADKAGTYEFYCSVGNHRAQGMVGTLIVE